jgi:hypothetical protein
VVIFPLLSFCSFAIAINTFIIIDEIAICGRFSCSMSHNRIKGHGSVENPHKKRAISNGFLSIAGCEGAKNNQKIK